MWKTDPKDTTPSLSGHSKGVLCSLVSSDDRLLYSGSEDSTVRVWDTKTYEEVAILKDHIGSVLSLAFCLEQTQLLTSGEDETIRLWNIKYTITDDTITWDESCLKPFQIFTDHSGHIHSIVFSNQLKQLYSASQDKTIRLYKLDHFNKFPKNSDM